MFKPSLPIAYNSMSARTIDRGASIQAAKVLYKLLGPADASSDIKRYFSSLLIFRLLYLYLVFSADTPTSLKQNTYPTRWPYVVAWRAI